MTIFLDVAGGEVYRIKQAGRESINTLVTRQRNGILLFKDDETNREKRFSVEQFEDMRDSGNAVRMRHRSLSDNVARYDLDPLSLIVKIDKDVSFAEREKIRIAKERLDIATSYVFFLRMWDENPQVSDSKIPVTTKIIKAFAEKAFERGITHIPSYDMLRRVRKYGSPGNRDLKVILQNHWKYDEEKRYPAYLVSIKKEVLFKFWSDLTWTVGDAYSHYCSMIVAERKRREAVGLTCERTFVYETIRLWIRKSENYERYRGKYGLRAADRYMRGRGSAIKADRILETVMIDQTRADAWAKIEDDEGNEILCERPWLVTAIDVHSRGILASVLTHEPPSLLTVMLCIKQMVRKKKFLIERYGDKASTSFYGKPFIVIVDNGWENIGQTFQAGLLNAGIHVEWAPIHTPEYKAYVERYFDTLNSGYFHKLEAGIPYKPQKMKELGLEPEKAPKHTVEVMQAHIWDHTVNIYHMTSHDGIHEQPARKWERGLRSKGRDTIDNIADLDRVFGEVDFGTLTASGIWVDGYRFHNQEAASDLIDRHVRLQPVRSQRTSTLTTAKIRVSYSKDPLDVSFLDVWDSLEHRFIRFLNCTFASDGLTDWKTADAIRAQGGDDVEAWHPDVDLQVERHRFRMTLQVEAKEGPYKERRKAAKKIYREKNLIAGSTVEEVFATPTPTGMDQYNVPSVLAKTQRDGDHIPPKGRRKGGMKATEKAMATRKRNAETKRAKEDEDVDVYEDDASYEIPEARAPTPSKRIHHEPRAASKQPEQDSDETGSGDEIDADAMMASFLAELTNPGRIQ